MTDDRKLPFAYLPWLVFGARWVAAITFMLLMLGTVVLASGGRIRFRWVGLVFVFQVAMLVAVPEHTP